MKGNAKVQSQKSNSQERYFVYIPASIVKLLEIKKGNYIDFDISNPKPEFVEEPRKGVFFGKKPEEPEDASSKEDVQEDHGLEGDQKTAFDALVEVPKFRCEEVKNMIQSQFGNDAAKIIKLAEEKRAKLEKVKPAM